MAAGIATLAALEPAALRRARGCRGRPGERARALRRPSAGREVAVSRVGSLLTVFFRRSRAARCGRGPDLRPGRLRPVLRGDARPRDPPAAVAVRGLVPRRWPTGRRRDRGDRRGGPRPRCRRMNDRFVRACRLEPVDATPVWFMRQAGRCFAAYRKLRERYGILELAKTPELCAEVTLMPVHELGVDAAVLFADIMLPLEPMGVGLRIEPEIGPIIDRPIRSAADVDGPPAVRPGRRLVHARCDPARPARARRAGRGHRLLRCAVHPRLLPDRGPAVARLRDGEGVHVSRAGGLARADGAPLDDGQHLPAAQVDAGAEVVQLFDSWVGGLGPADYATFVQPHVRRIFDDLRRRADDPLRDRARRRSSSSMADGGRRRHRASTTGSRSAAAWRRVGHDRGVQGNLDAARLLAGWEATEAGALAGPRRGRRPARARLQPRSRRAAGDRHRTCSGGSSTSSTRRRPGTGVAVARA